MNHAKKVSILRGRCPNSAVKIGSGVLLCFALASGAAAAAPEWQRNSAFGFSGKEKYGMPCDCLGGLTLKLGAQYGAPVFFQWGIGGNLSIMTFEEAGCHHMHCVGAIGPNFHGPAAFTGSWAGGSVKYSACEAHVSRLTPAVLIETQEKILFFSNQPRKLPGELGLTQPDAFPKFYAFEDDLGETHVGMLAAGGQEFEKAAGALNVPWLLLWYGPAYFTTDLPLAFIRRYWSDSAFDWQGKLLPGWYKGDRPILFVFSQSLEAIEGGQNRLAVHFDGPAGRTAVVQPFEKFFALQDTSNWFDANKPETPQHLPEAVVEQCRRWARLLQSFPADVEESWELEENGDVVIREKFTHLPLNPAEPPAEVWLPAPPMWAVAQEHGFPIDFGRLLEDTGVYTLCGPYRGFYGNGEYEARISGIAKYWRETRRTLPAAGPAPDALRPLAERLERETDRVVVAGHLAPWIYQAGKTSAYLRWENPGEAIYYLSGCLDFLPEPKRGALIKYMRAEDEAYPAEGPVVPASKGVRREWGQSEYYENEEWDLLSSRTFFSTNALTPPQSLYYLAEAALRAPEALSKPVAERWEKLKAIPLPYLARLDWASGSFFWPGGLTGEVGVGEKAFSGGGVSCGVIDQNYWFAGAAGLARLAEIAGDRETLAFAAYLLARAALTRTAMANFVPNLYRHGAQTMLPEEKLAAVKADSGLHSWWCSRHRFHEWIKPEDDVRQIVTMDQFTTVLDATMVLSVNRSIIPFVGLTPECGRLLKEHAAEPSIAFIRAMERVPYWHIAMLTSLWGREQGFEYPECAQQVFLAKAWIEAAPAEKLAKLVDVPWVKLGDLYYLQKLSETLRAWRGTTWEKTF